MTAGISPALIRAPFRRRRILLSHQSPSARPREVVRVFAALSDENRFRIVELLSGNGTELACGAVGTALGMSPSLVSHHLSILEGAGIIARRKNGLWTLNRLRRDELLRHLECLGRMLEAHGAD